MNENLLRDTAIASAAFAAVLLTLGMIPGGARADSDGEEEQLALAFRAGASSVVDTSLEIERHGATTVLASSSSGDNPGERLELVCHLCSFDELMASSRALGAAVAVSAGNGQPGTIAFTGAEEDALVFIDGVRSRDGGSARAVEPGDHGMLVQGGGRARVSRAILEPGEDLVIDLDTIPLDPYPRRLRGGVIIAGMGVALAAAGAALTALDGDCASTTVDSAGNCRDVHQLAPAGWSMVGTGCAAFVAGVVTAIVSAVRMNASEDLDAREVER